jgi:hypothetical protein
MLDSLSLNGVGNGCAHDQQGQTNSAGDVGHRAGAAAGVEASGQGLTPLTLPQLIRS